MDDYLSAGLLIVSRLQSASGQEKIFTSADLDGVVSKSQFTPAIHVLYGGDRPGDSGADTISADEQLWNVVIAVKNVSDTVGGGGCLKDAGPLMAKAIRLLANWRPSAAHHPLRRVAGGAAFYEAGYAYFPLAFTTAVVVLPEEV